eukprot:gene4643-3346_t
MSSTDSEYDEEYEEEPPRFHNVELSSALQNCRVFNNVPLNVDGCMKAMMNLLYLLYSGRATLSEDEATEIFFMSTKLMQSTNIKLRRLHYVLIKELSPLVEARYIASNTLVVDMKNSSSIIRRNALRTLYAVLDTPMYHTMDRTIVECLNSGNPELVNTALVIGLHIATENIEIAKKWSTQLSCSGRTQDDNHTGNACRAALLHAIRNNDRLSAQRLLKDARTGVIRAPLALAFIVNVCGDQLHQMFSKTGNIEDGEEFLKFIHSMTHHHNEMVVSQACQVLCTIPHLSESGAFSCVSRLTERLSSSSNVTRFTAAMLLSKMARLYPAAVGTASANLEARANDSQPGVATYAIIGLLLTGSEEEVVRLLSQLCSGNAFKAMDDDFKLVMINTTLDLHKKFPSSLEPIVNFLFLALTEVHSLVVKERIVDTMIHLSKKDAATKETILTKLADCIDDCDYPSMTKRVLAYLSEEVPQCAIPRRYVRYIYNHCKLEQAEIRAVAVRSLAKIAAKLPQLRSFILPLLARCCIDEDDEVRDRAVFYTKLFATKDDRLIERNISDIADEVAVQRTVVASRKVEETLATSAKTADSVVAARVEGTAAAPSGSAAGHMSAAVLEGRDALGLVAPLRQLGAPVKSCEPVELTEADHEYAVRVIKHLTPTHVIFQFAIRNTMAEESFAHVTVACDLDELEAEPQFAIPAEVVAPGEVRYAYVVAQYTENAFPSGEVPCSIKFVMREVGEEGLAVDEKDLEEFPMESFELDIADYFKPLSLDHNFEERWEAAAEAGETAGTYELPSMRNLTVAVKEIANFFGLHVLGGIPEKVTAASHTLRMSGTAANTERSVLLMKAKVFISTTGSVVLQMVMRGGDDDLREFLTNALLS